jgi:hypothetical protein
MKTIVRKSDNTSAYLLPDTAVVDLSGTRLSVTGGAIFTVMDLPPNSVNVHENVTAGDVLVGTSTKITEWIGNKFTFNGTAWGNNPDWEDFHIPCSFDGVGDKCVGTFTPPSKVCSECGETNP